MRLVLFSLFIIPLSTGGDVNGDGLDDVVGASQAESGGMSYLIFGE